MSPSAVGLVPMATDYENYKDIGNGAKFPYTINIVGPSRPDCAAITVEKFQVNAAVDNAKFAKPQGAAQ